MKANGRRAWRKYAKREQRRAVGQDFYWTHDARGNVAAHGRRHLKQFGPRPPARPFTPRSLVGMSQRRRKALFHVEFDAAREDDGTVSMFIGDALLSKYRIGQRLRPCPGCCACFYRCDPDFTDGVCADCGQAHATCDGFGVLAAGSEK